jgi:hypothetical protein
VLFDRFDLFVDIQMDRRQRSRAALTAGASSRLRSLISKSRPL